MSDSAGSSKSSAESAGITHLGMNATQLGTSTTNDEDDAEPPNADGSRKRKYHGISFLIPKDWKEISLSRALQRIINSKYKIVTEHGDLELTLTNMGGDWESNIERWPDQMGQKGRGKRDSFTLDGADSHWVDVEGDYLDKFNDIAGPHEGFRIVGGVIVIKPQNFTLKLLGPSKAVDDYHDKFMEFTKTAKIGG